MPVNCDRALRLSACAAALLLFSRPAPAQPPKGRLACEVVYKNALKLEKQGQLVDARRKALSCARPECGRFLEQQCTALSAQLEADTPSIVPVATDADGAPVSDVSVTMDGAPLSSQMDGRALSIDPGVHEFSFELDGSVVAQKKLVIVQGQRNRAITVKLTKRGGRKGRGKARATVEADTTPDESAAADEEVETRQARSKEKTEAEEKVKQAITSDEDDRPEKSEGGSYMPSLLVMGVGVAGITGWALLTYWGNKDNDQLSQCSPNCPASSLDHIRHLYLASDISLGVGIPALLTGAWLAYRNHSASSSSGYALDVSPTASGIFASVRGAF